MTVDLARVRGLTSAEAARVLGVHPGSVRRARSREQRILGPDLALAQALLEERAGYPEAARTIGVSAAVLRERLPGYRQTNEDRAVLASILARPDLRRLHDEFRGASTDPSRPRA